MRRWWICRHGRTAWNVEQRLQGWRDIELDEVGKEQAAVLRRRLSGIVFEGIFVSSLSRALQTRQIAAPLMRVGGEAFESLDGLRERCYGSFETQSLADPQVMSAYKARAHDPDDDLDGGESLSCFRARVASTLESMKTSVTAGDILVIAHGGTNAQLVSLICDRELSAERRLRQPNDEVWMVEERPSGPIHWRYFDDGDSSL